MMMQASLWTPGASMGTADIPLQATLPNLDIRLSLLERHPEKVRAAAADIPWDPQTPLLSTNKAADFVLLRQSSLLRIKLAAYLARHTQLAAPNAKTSETQFQVATADDAQNLNVTAIEAVSNDRRRSLLGASTARQVSAAYIGSNHVDSAMVADLYDLKGFSSLSHMVLNPRILTIGATLSASDQKSASLHTSATSLEATEQVTDFSDPICSVGNIYGNSGVTRIRHEASGQSNVYGNVAGPSQQVVQVIATYIVGAWIKERGRRPDANGATNEHGRQSTGTGQVGNIDKDDAQDSVNNLSNKRSAPPSEDEDEPTDHPRKRKRRQISSSDTDSVRLFACPYHKYNPSRYSQTNLVEKQYRGCSSRYLPSIARLKYGLDLDLITGTQANRISSVRQHLQRTHERPRNYCGRCCEVYSTRSELDEHTNQASRCAPSMPRYTERMTDEQSLAIRRKHPKETAEENWYRIWRILFPEADAPASPYIEESVKGTLDDFLRYFRLRASAHINEGLQAAGLMPAAHLVQQNTSRILDEAISQILTEYNILNTQGHTNSAPSAVESQESTNMSASLPGGSSRHVATASVRPTLDTSLTGQPHTDSSSLDNTHHELLPLSTTRLPQSNIELPQVLNIPPSGCYSNNYPLPWNLPSNSLDAMLPQSWLDWQPWDLDGMLTSTS